MPISLNYNSDENVIYTKAEGVVKLNDVLSYFSSVAALNLQKSYRVLADYSDVILKLSSEDIHTMSIQRNIDSSKVESVKIAVYCSEDLTFGLGRIYEALIDYNKYNVMIFRSEKKAREWLGI
ncbi:MAG: hypothetical protein OQL06_11085 [Gammaproteobacteria bacterium]|nr:hypothetical protein [Gammaproteobacteria bacterium]